MDFIACELAPEPAVQAVIGTGSIASGLAREDSDIDAVVFLDPLDAYIVPAEFIWLPADRSFHSIFSEAPGLEQGIQFDFQRFDFAQWMQPSFDWPEGYRSELSLGWLAFDRTGKAAEWIASRTTYTDDLRISRLDEAITQLDQLLADERPHTFWDSLGPLIAQDRLQAAFEYLLQALFAYNRCWRPWRSREMSFLLALPWLPQGFADRALAASRNPSPGYDGYMERAALLRALFQDLTTRLIADGLYGAEITGEAFIRGHEEPGRAWNMDEWNRQHAGRRK